MEMNTSWWDLPTNYSNGSSAADTVSEVFFTYPNYTLGNYAGAGWTLLIFVISLSLSGVVGIKKSLSIAGFISFIFSIYFVRLGMLNLIVTIALMVITILGLIGGKEEGGL